jgi:hypothetical protein
MRAGGLCRREAAQPGRFRVSAATPRHPSCGTHLRGRKSCAAGARLYLDSCRARCENGQAVWLGHWRAIRMSVQVPGDSPAAGPRPGPGGPAPFAPGAASSQLVLTGRSGGEGFICNAVLESALALLVWAPLAPKPALDAAPQSYGHGPRLSRGSCAPVRVPCGMISILLRGAAGSGGRVAAYLARCAMVRWIRRDTPQRRCRVEVVGSGRAGRRPAAAHRLLASRCSFACCRGFASTSSAAPRASIADKSRYVGALLLAGSAGGAALCYAASHEEPAAASALHVHGAVRALNRRKFLCCNNGLRH